MFMAKKLMNMWTLFQIAFSLKLIYRFNKVPIKILAGFKKKNDTGKLILKFTQKGKELSQNNFEKEHTGGIPLLALKTY